jgi:hypothetical protein
MKVNRILSVACVTTLLLAGMAHGSIAGYQFRELVKKTEIIVEGDVTSQIDINQDIRSDDTKHHKKESVFRITRVLKGNVSVGDKITVRSHRNFICDTCRLRKNQRYVLMLKGNGQWYVDINSGQGTWPVIKLGQRHIAVAGATSGGHVLEAFRKRIAWALRDPAPRKPKPAITKAQALAAAKKALAASKVDLTGYKLKKVKLLAIGSDSEGFAYKGDPVWLCDWEKPQAKGKSPRAAGTFVYCYVHAQNGAVSSAFIKTSTTVSHEDICRIFLKTYQPFGERFSTSVDKVQFTKITEGQLRKLAAGVTYKFNRVIEKYPKGTRFYSAKSSPDIDRRSLLFVLYAGRNVHFAGILPAADKTGT